VNRWRWQPGTLLGLFLTVFAAADGLPVGQGLHFSVHVEGAPSPLPLNTMHSWVLVLVDSAGRPLRDVQIQVDGGMPEHDHGLPTAPRVTRELSPGRYLLEGLRFHMNGRWQLLLDITAAGERETVVLIFTVGPR
jgi:hypothetical protein